MTGYITFFVASCNKMEREGQDMEGNENLSLKFQSPKIPEEQIDESWKAILKSIMEIEKKASTYKKKEKTIVHK